jgi:hypothetical protein
MEVTGLDDIIVFTLDQDDKLNTDPTKGGFSYDGDKGKVFDPTTHAQIPGLFKIDLASSKGATQANITGIASTVSRVYGSNAIAEVNSGAEQPSIALGANDIPHEIYDQLAGLTKDKLGSYVRKGRSNPTKGGVIIHTANKNKGIDLYVAFPYGTFAPGELNLGTDTENENVVHDALTLSASSRPSDLLLYAKFYSNEADFDFTKMIKFVTGQAIDNDVTPTNQSLNISESSK